MKNDYGDHFNGNEDYTDISRYTAPPSIKDERKQPLPLAYNTFMAQKKPRSKKPFVIILCFLLTMAIGFCIYAYLYTPWLNSIKDLFFGVSGSFSSSSTNLSSIADSTSSSSANHAEKETIFDNGSDGYTNGSVYIWDNKAFELFHGNDDAATYYAEAISNYKKLLGDTITVYNMVVPGHAEFGLPKRISTELSGDQRHNLDSIYNNYSAKIKPIDIYDTLQQHINEYVFFDTDHHWTGKGSYYAYKEFAKSADIKAMDIEQSTRNSIDGFLGSLYTATQDPILEKYPDRVDYYTISGDFDVTVTDKDADTWKASLYFEGAQPGSNTYGTFLWGDNPFTTIINKEAQTNRKIAIVKESYGNAIVPYIAYNYSEVYVVDFRYYSENLKTLCEQNNINEVLFINGIMSANTASQIDNMNNLFI